MTPTIGRIGIWTVSRQWPSDPAATAAAAAELDELGFGTLWIGLSTGDLDLQRTVLAASRRLVVATGIIDVWTNPARTVAENTSRLAVDHPGRFLLGLGSGHAEFVEAITGEPYRRPLARLATYLDELDNASTPVPTDLRVLAALGPRAIALAGERSAGAVPYLVTPEHTADARRILGPEPLLAPEQKVVFERDPSAARAIGRDALELYLGLPNYLRSLERLGFDQADFADGGSDRLVDSLVAWGDDDAIAARLNAHFVAGADHVAVQVIAVNPGQLPIDDWRHLAAVTSPAVAP